MRITGKLAAVAAGLCIVAGAHVVQASDAMKAIVGSYLEIHAQLAADKVDGVKASATALAARAEGLGEAGTVMVKTARTVGAAADLKAAREAFGDPERRRRRRGEGGGLEGSRRREARLLSHGQALVAAEGREDQQSVLRHRHAYVRRVQEALTANRRIATAPKMGSGTSHPMNISFVHQKLANGLDVIVHEDHDCPIVAVNVWYHVGSKNEQPGRTGFAHLFEHLMFEGSEHHDAGYFRPLQEVGGVLNGSTNADRTNYWEVVPSNAVELALWMESDRMGYLLPALTDAKFENQRNVVLNERRQNYENRPYGFAGMSLVAALYPPEHPYHWMTIGAAEDLKAARLDDVRAFFQTYYRPRNASLALAGDIDADRAMTLAAEYFGGLDAGPEPPPVVAPNPSLTGERRLVLEDRIELPRLYLAWHSPALFAEDDAELDLVSEVLAGSKTSRLYRRLVYEQRIATEVAASQGSRELGSFFQIVATAAPGRTLVELEQAIACELARLHAEGPSAAELERCLAQAEAHFLHRLQTVGGFGGKSDQLNAYNVYLGRPGYFDEDLARYRRADAAGLTRAAARWLGTGRVALSVVPHGRAALALSGSQPVSVS